MLFFFGDFLGHNPLRKMKNLQTLFMDYFQIYHNYLPKSFYEESKSSRQSLYKDVKEIDCKCEACEKDWPAYFMVKYIKRMFYLPVKKYIVSFKTVWK